jgi:hypothetical protein
LSNNTTTVLAITATGKCAFSVELFSWLSTEIRPLSVSSLFFFWKLLWPWSKTISLMFGAIQTAEFHHITSSILLHNPTLTGLEAQKVNRHND